MELPVSNRIIAIRRIEAIHFMLIALFIPTLLQTHNLDTLKYLIVIVSISSIISFIHFKKQNIHRASFDKGTIKLHYNKDTIEFPISQIISISESLNDYFSLNGEISFTYTIELNQRHQFGHRLFLHFDKINIFGIEPKEILELREKIKMVAKRTV